MHPNGFFAHYIQDIAITTRFYYEGAKDGTIILARCVHTKRNVEFNVSFNAMIQVGKHTCINSNCYIASMRRIVIGDNCEIAPGVIIVDHDHDFKVAGGLREQKYNISPVIIGNNVWIGANAVILKGSRIGDNSVIAAGSVVSGTIPENSIVLQKRTTTVNNYKKLCEVYKNDKYYRSGISSRENTSSIYR